MAQDDEGQGRGLWFMVSAAVVVLVVVAAVALSISNLIGSDETEASPSSSSSKDSKDPSGSVCGLKPGDSSSDTLTSAPQTEWRLVDRVAAPEVEDAGPGEIGDDQFGYCFAQSPTGAVVAAANIMASTTTPERQAKAYKRLAVDGPGRTKILKALESGELGDTNPEGVSLQIAGFHVDRYADKEASIDLAVTISGETETDTYVSMPMELRWVDGDWKVVVNDDGTVYDSEPLDDLSGYVIWSGA